MAIDDPILLSDLLEVPDLRDVVQSFADMHRVAVSLVECADSGSRLLTTTAARESDIEAALGNQVGPVVASSATPDQRVYIVPLNHQGEVLARIAIGPYPAEPGADSGAACTDDTAGRVARHVTSVLEILVHNAYARYLTAAMHTEAMEVNFAELNAKNERLEKAVERMQEVDRLKSSFLATMSHELRTPLTSVIGYSEMLLEGLAGAINAEQRDYIKTILSKADQLLQLISGILDVAMLEGSTPGIRREALNLDELVDSVIATCRPALRGRQISVRMDQAPLPRVFVDRQKVLEILRNLLTNAIKFTAENGHIEIILKVGPMRPAGIVAETQLGLQVIMADSGIGIPRDQQAQIFEPFFQVDSSSTRQYGGSGLGLTLAKRYVEAHGGHIWVDSQPGHGSSFTVSLPAEPSELDAYLTRTGQHNA